MKETICTVVGVVGSFVAWLFGGWDASIRALLLFMAVDYATGLILAGVFRKSPKTKSGGLQSKIGWKGIARKGVTLLLVLISAQLDLILDTTYIRDAVCIAFSCNELISILENAGLMGIPMPAALKKQLTCCKARERMNEYERNRYQQTQRRCKLGAGQGGRRTVRHSPGRLRQGSFPERHTV